ncbi:hypothetical protein RFI_15421 [Reticulomyxa filosa]|uniref:Uncharacterized protein n=1 Tax=Reticulomyxa filosa TaxID=46433 RepID=X6N790_RETFI|nr:hypothetical protein RFI_15421 [Reticulomyxa filosa]|eukprot:ETO21783.1 hypothetical protein RFI_15421 [Reticulomyxa filosa]
MLNSLDCHDQWKGLENSGQFRFTPPTHTICALQQALDEFVEEGGVQARMARYKKNQKIVTEAILKLGFELYLDPKDCGHIITSIRYPKSKNWDFNKFYNKLAEQKLRWLLAIRFFFCIARAHINIKFFLGGDLNSFLIYPGKVTNADCFRIGHIGHIYPQDCERLVKILRQVCSEMNLFEIKK